jgi:hypothetical protein
MWVDYDGETMDVYLRTAAELAQLRSGEPLKPAWPLVSAYLRLAEVFGPSGGDVLRPGYDAQRPVRFGFTASTGASYNTHEVVLFHLHVVPEPSGLGLAAIGGGLIVALSRRRLGGTATVARCGKWRATNASPPVRN